MIFAVFSAAIATPLQLTNVGPRIEQATIDAPVPTEIYPIGFSDRGRFAWIEIVPDEAVGCLLWHLRIDDLVTGERAGGLRWSDASCEQIVDLPSLLAARQPDLERVLAEHGIAPDPARSLSPIPFSLAGASVQISVDPAGPAPKQPFAPRPLDVNASIDGRRGRLGGVAIRYTHDLPSEWGHVPLGALISPHEPRAVIFVQHVRSGFEGQQSLHVRPFGLSLDATGDPSARPPR